MISRLYKLAVTAVIVLLLYGGWKLYATGTLDPWYYRYEISEASKVGPDEAKRRLKPDAAPADAASAAHCFVQWEGKVVELRSLGSVSALVLAASDPASTRFAAVTDRPLEAGIGVGAAARVTGLYKPLLIDVKDGGGRALPTVVAIEVSRPPSGADRVRRAMDLLDEVFKKR